MIIIIIYHSIYDVPENYSVQHLTPCFQTFASISGVTLKGTSHICICNSRVYVSHMTL